MSKLVEGYEEYLQIYDRYQKNKQQIDAVHEKVVEAQEKLKVSQERVKRAKKQQTAAEDKSRKTERELKEFIPLYDREAQRRPTESEVEAFRRNQTYFHGELADDGVYRRRQETIIFSYEQKKSQYYIKRKQELEQQRTEAEAELEHLNQDRKGYVQERKEQICSGCDSVIDAKKDEILQYLSCNSQIKNSECTDRIHSVLKNEMPDPEKCGKSEKTLLQTVMALEGTEKYARNNKVTLQDIQCNEGAYTSIRKPFLIGAGIVLFLIFAFVFSPANLLLPSSATFTGTAHAAIQTIVRIGCTVLFGALVGGITYGVLRLFGMDTIAIIVGIAVGIFGAIYCFNGNYLIISENSLFWLGGGLHFIIVWLIQILIGAGIVFLLAWLTDDTELARFFYRPVNNRVLDDLKRFEDYFHANQESYVALFHIDEAVGYACENRIKAKIDSCEHNIQEICHENTYIGMEDSCKKELKELLESRQKQIDREKADKGRNADRVEQKRIEVNAREDSRLSSLKRRLDNLKKVALEAKYNFNASVRAAENAEKEEKECSNYLSQITEKENQLIQEAAKDKNYLLEQTEKFCAADDVVVKNFLRMRDASTLIESCGNLEKEFYFVENKRDENEMAVIEKIPLSCRPTVYIYDKSCIQGNNLSDELSGFIGWFCRSMMRITPSQLLHEKEHDLYFTVVDMFSGKGALTYPPYNAYISKIISDESEKKELVELLQDQERKIRTVITEGYNRASSIDMLNRAIVEDLEEDIKKATKDDIQDVLRRKIKLIVRYFPIIFVVSPAIMDTAQRSVMNEEIMQFLKNSERLGILPVFLVDDENWENPKANPDVAFLKGIQDKAVWKIQNIGKNQEEPVRLELAS